MAYKVHVVTQECGAARWPYAMPMFVSRRLGIVFNLTAGAITDHSQSAKDIDLYFRFQLYVEVPGQRKPLLILPDGLSKPEERAHDRNFISAAGGIRTHNLLIDNPACYH